MLEDKSLDSYRTEKKEAEKHIQLAKMLDRILKEKRIGTCFLVILKQFQIAKRDNSLVLQHLGFLLYVSV